MLLGLRSLYESTASTNSTLIFDASSTVRPLNWTPGRNSNNATYFNSSGSIVTAAANTERINYDPYTKALLGLLVERSSTNYLLQSNDFGYSTWYKNPNNTTLTFESGVNLDGSNTVAHLYENAFGSTIARPPETQSLIGAYISVWFYNRTGTSQIAAFWDGGKNNMVTIPAVTGWVRVGYLVDSSVTTTPNFDFYPAGGNNIVDGNLWGAQLESGPNPTSYIDTGLGSNSAVATRAADIYTFTLRQGTTKLIYTFDDGSKQTATGLTGGNSYTIPTNLNRPNILKIEDDYTPPAAAVMRRRASYLIAS